MNRPVIGITTGDPAGVGPEIIRACLRPGVLPDSCDFEVAGPLDGHTPGQPTPEGARAALDALEFAAARLADGSWHGVVTGPVSKHALHLAGCPFPGQTEFFAARAGVGDHFAMCLTGDRLTVGLVTIHVPVSAVPGLVTRPAIVRSGRLLAGFLRRTGIGRPRIAVAGLNPHAGENGDIGTEELTTIEPAVRELASDTSAEFSGPFPPDTVFRGAADGACDAVLCMYHDQGLIPFKLLCFETGVNATLGLPFPRTSPDHGTAFSIAGRGIASPASFLAAARLAARLASTERPPGEQG